MRKLNEIERAVLLYLSLAVWSLMIVISIHGALAIDVIPISNLGGGDNISVYGLELYYAECTENWACGSWTACLNTTQDRSCTETHNCGTNISMPETSRNCTTATGGGSGSFIKAEEETLLEQVTSKVSSLEGEKTRQVILFSSLFIVIVLIIVIVAMKNRKGD